MTIDDGLRRKLEAPLPKDAVKNRAQSGQSLSYIEGWYAIDEANKVFGFDGWSSELVEQRIVREYTRKGSRGENLVLVAQATVRVRALGVVREDVGVGVCDASADNPVSGIEKALKEAATDALKRCLRTFGYRFGLALYDKDKEHVGGSAEALRLLDELRTLPDAELDAWAKRNAEALAGLDGEDKPAVREAYAARKRAVPPPPAVQAAHAAVDAAEAHVAAAVAQTPWVAALRADLNDARNARGGARLPLDMLAYLLCEHMPARPDPSDRQAAWDAVKAAGPEKASAAAIKRAVDAERARRNPPPTGTDAPRAAANDAPPADATGGGAAAADAGGAASARSLDAYRAYLSTKATVSEVERAFAAHVADYDADEAAQMRVAVARLRALAPDMSEGICVNRLRIAINDRARRRGAAKAAAALAVVANARKVA